VKTPPRRGRRRCDCCRASQVLNAARRQNELCRGISMTASSSGVHPSLFSNEPYSSACQVSNRRLPFHPLTPFRGLSPAPGSLAVSPSLRHTLQSRADFQGTTPPSHYFTSCSLLSLATTLTPKRTLPLTLHAASRVGCGGGARVRLYHSFWRHH
jgi:hypothetical protein